MWCSLLSFFLRCGTSPYEWGIQSVVGASVMLVLGGISSTFSLPSLPGPLWPRTVASDWVQSLGQIELNCILMLNKIVWKRTVFTFNYVWINGWCLIELLEIHSNTWSHLTLLTKLNSLKLEGFWYLNCVLMLKWIICNRTVQTFNCM